MESVARVDNYEGGGFVALTDHRRGAFVHRELLTADLSAGRSWQDREMGNEGRACEPRQLLGDIHPEGLPVSEATFSD